MTPTWPRLAGWLATPARTTARGRWSVREGGAERSGTFAFRAPDDWWVAEDDGAPGGGGRASRRRAASRGPRDLLRPWEWYRDDYSHPAGPVTATRHDGRPAWRVELEPPPRKSGRLELVVDDATGICLRASNADHDVVEEVTALEVDVPLDDAVFTAARRERARRDRELALLELCSRRPVPSPRWFPWRRTWVELEGCRAVAADPGDGLVSRAPLGTQAPLPDHRPEHVVRLEARGWSWAVASWRPLTLSDARRVAEAVVDAPRPTRPPGRDT